MLTMMRVVALLLCLSTLRAVDGFPSWSPSDWYPSDSWYSGSNWYPSYGWYSEMSWYPSFNWPWGDYGGCDTGMGAPQSIGTDCGCQDFDTDCECGGQYFSYDNMCDQYPCANDGQPKSSTPSDPATGSEEVAVY